MVHRIVITSLLTVPTVCMAQRGVGDAELHAVAANLQPGQSVWTAAPDGDIEVVVSLALQRAYVYRAQTLMGVAAVSTGRPGKATPMGEFTILQKARWHRSNLYSNAPMPFMQRLTWTGIALHAGVNPGYPASHGCIRLPADFARDLFALTNLGTTVTVTNYPLQTPVWLEVEGLSEEGARLTYRLDTL